MTSLVSYLLEQFVSLSRPLSLVIEAGSTVISRNCASPISATLFSNNLETFVDFRYQIPFLHCCASFRIQISSH